VRGSELPGKNVDYASGLERPRNFADFFVLKWKDDAAVMIDLAPGQDWTSALRNGAGRRDLIAARGALRKALPQRLADRWIERHEPEDWTNRSLEMLEDGVHRWRSPTGTEGYDKAEVTAGGVNTARTFEQDHGEPESTRLFFIGEV